MKGLLISGALALLVAGTATAMTPLMTDDFAYGATAGNLTVVAPGVWNVSSGASPFVMYQSSTLSLAGYAFGGTGGSATISTSGSEDVNRTIGPAQTGDVYLSALMNFSAAGAGSYFFHLKDAGTNFRARVFAQDNGGNLRFGFSNTSTGTYSTTNFAYNTTYLVVVHYNGTTGVSDLWVLTSVPATAPAPLLSQTDAAILATMEGVGIRQAAGGPTGAIDGIRVGTTWDDLLPVELMNFEVK